MQTLNIDEMRGQLLTLDAARERLAPTEGLREYEFPTDGSVDVEFTLPEGWNNDLDTKADFDLTDATMRLNGEVIPLTKSGALDIASEIGVNNAVASETPGPIVAPFLNYHYTHGGRGKNAYKVLASNIGGLGICRGTVTPFSNSALLEAVVAGLSAHADETDILVDYKLPNDLDASAMRVILPSTRNIRSARSDGSDDQWSLGIEINNSLTGKGSLELRGYMFAWWCTNGATVTRASSGKYRRKPSRTPNDAYEWARGAVDEVFADLEPELAGVEALTQVDLEGELGATVGRMFDRFEIPTGPREPIMANLVESDDLTAYGLMNAITFAANDPSLSASAVAQLLMAGGEVSHVLSDRCDVCHRF